MQGTSASDLLNLEAEARAALIAELDRRLTEDAAERLAREFVDRTVANIGPGLAQWMAGVFQDRIAHELRIGLDQLEGARATSFEGAQRKLLGVLQSAGRRSDEISTTAQTAQHRAADSKDAAAASEGFAMATQMAGEMSSILNGAEEEVGKLGDATVAMVAVLRKRSSSVQMKLLAAAQADASAAQHADGVTASQELRTALSETMTAVLALPHHGRVLRARIEEGIADELLSQIRRQLEEDLRKVTLPRLGAKFRSDFLALMNARELNRDGLDKQVEGDITTRLLAMVLARLSPPSRSLPEIEVPLAETPSDHGPRGPRGRPRRHSLGSSALDQELDAQIAALGQRAREGTAALARDDGLDAGFLEQSRRGEHGSQGAHGETDGLRDVVGALQGSLSGGRLGSTAVTLGLDGVRARVLGSVQDEAAYASAAGVVEGRQGQTGSRWQRNGAAGPVSRGEVVTGIVPAVILPATREIVRGTGDVVPYMPDFKTLAFAAAPFVGNDFRIDGVAAKWSEVPPLLLQPEGGDDTSVQSVQVGWSSLGFFIRCDVKDRNGNIDKADLDNFWEADVVEVWFDVFNGKKKHRTRNIGQQFWAWPFGAATDGDIIGGESTVYEDGSFDPVGLRLPDIGHWAAPSQDGWVMELHIPANRIPGADLAAGRIIGFNVYLGTWGGTGWFWSAGKAARTARQPDTWGDLLLAGSDATLGLPDLDRDGVLTIGRPLEIHVRDSDMDLAADARDTVMVTVQRPSGEQQIVILEETGVRTGKFTGSVSTTLALDRTPPPILGVYEGDRIRVTYVDQARQNGARQVPISISARFGGAAYDSVK
jgi:hypothetical protein